MIGTLHISGMMGVSIILRHEGEYVRFIQGEHVTCNDAVLPFVSYSFTAHLSTSRRFVCSYIDPNSLTTTFGFTIPNDPIIISPTAGATILRSNLVPVNYVPVPASKMHLNVFSETGYSKPDAPPVANITPFFKPQNEGTFVCDLVDLHAGPGKVQLYMGLEQVLFDTGFHAASLSIALATNVDVTWI